MFILRKEFTAVKKVFWICRICVAELVWDLGCLVMLVEPFISVSQNKTQCFWQMTCKRTLILLSSQCRYTRPVSWWGGYSISFFLASSILHICNAEVLFVLSVCYKDKFVPAALSCAPLALSPVSVILLGSLLELICHSVDPHWGGVGDIWPAQTVVLFVDESYWWALQNLILIVSCLGDELVSEGQCVYGGICCWHRASINLWWASCILGEKS